MKWVRRARYLLAGLAVCSLILGFVVDTGTPSPAASVEENSLPPVSNGDSMKLLGVPYVDQGPTRWCFQAALCMILQYNGKSVQPTDIAGACNANPDRATSIIDVFFGWVGSYVARWSDLSLHRSLAAWTFERFKIVLSNAGGEPVIVSTFGIPGHTVVVVGYSVENGKNYLYLHDPSGYLTQDQWNTGSRVFVKVTWEKFCRSYWAKIFVTRSAKEATPPLGTLLPPSGP
jgi:hypothetical protein